MPSARAIAVPLDDIDVGDRGKLGTQCGFYYGWVIVLLCILCKVWKCQGQNNIMTYTVPHLLEEFGLSHSELGSLFSVATISAGVVQPSMGRLVDRLGGRACIPATQLLLAVTLLLFSVWRPSSTKLFLYLEVIFVFFFLRSLCLGAAETFPNACIQQWFKRRRGRALSLTTTCQQLGNGIAASVVSGLVAGAGWRFAMQAGACANFVLAPVSFLLLRARPEDCGLLPDGDGVASPGGAGEDMDGSTLSGTPQVVEQHSGIHPKLPGVAAAEERKAVPELPPGLWQLFTFAFFYAIIFGGIDFYMVEMVAEAAGPRVGDIRVSDHIFAPLALTIAASAPFIGELMDNFSQKRPWISSCLLSFCAFLTALVTQMTCVITSPLVAVSYGVLRGVTSTIFASLLTSGLVFSARGVGRERIGSVLGFTQFATLAGTGCGPFIYGVCRDVFGRFRGALFMTSLPHFVLGVLFLRTMIMDVKASRSYTALQTGASSTGGVEPSSTAASKISEKSSSVVAKKHIEEEEDAQMTHGGACPASPRIVVIEPELVGSPHWQEREMLPGCV